MGYSIFDETMVDMAWPEIEKAYRTKAKIHHPDRGGDEDAMRLLNEVYARLKSVKRS